MEVKTKINKWDLMKLNSLLMTILIPLGGWVLLVMGTGYCDEKSESHDKGL